MAKPASDKEKLEFEPDAWQRFERAVTVVAKSPPQHRTKTTKKTKVRRTKRTKKNAV
jgi:hypothetical protein